MLNKITDSWAFIALLAVVVAINVFNVATSGLGESGVIPLLILSLFAFGYVFARAMYKLGKPF